MVFFLVYLLIGCSIMGYSLYTAKDVDTVFSKELADFEFKNFTRN